MLILTRKPGESLYIGDHIKITIVELKGHQIRVGIEAPKDMRIYREEIYLQILEENKKAAEAPAGVEIGLENLSAVFGAQAESSGPQSSGGTGGSDDQGGQSKPRMAGLASFSTAQLSKTRVAGPAPTGERDTPVRTSASKDGASKDSQPRDPEIVVRRKKPKKADE